MPIPDVSAGIAAGVAPRTSSNDSKQCERLVDEQSEIHDGAGGLRCACPPYVSAFQLFFIVPKTEIGERPV